jgi:hypothetical protein
VTVAVGEIRLLGRNRVFETGILPVKLGASCDGMIGLAEAEALVAANEAQWAWRDDEAIAVTSRGAKPPSAPVPVAPRVSIDVCPDDLGERLDRALARANARASCSTST